MTDEEIRNAITETIDKGLSNFNLLVTDILTRVTNIENRCMSTDKSCSSLAKLSSKVEQMEQESKKQEEARKVCKKTAQDRTWEILKTVITVLVTFLVVAMLEKYVGFLK